MSNAGVRFDEELAENIGLAAQVSSCVVLTGLRQFDRFLIAGAGGEPRIVNLERLCHDRVGAIATWTYDPARGNAALARSNGERNLETALPTQVGGEGKQLKTVEVIEAFANLKSGDQAQRFALLVDAGLLLEDPAAPRDADFRLLRSLERFARTADRTRVMFLRVARTTLLPGAILSSPQVRTIHIPAASRDVRHAYALMRTSSLAKRCQAEPIAVAQTLGDATDDWTLDQLDALVQTADRQGAAHLHDVEELARAVRIGTTHSPWAGERIRAAVNRADDLTKRVLGQPQAVNAVVSALRKAVIGLSTAHQSQGSQAPRAIFFFAGPTGTGKTELAKAVSQLVFGQEQLLRFDCGELRQEHAVARLIGAPPGYVGYDRGGELTEGIRAKPNSVVLFDEIEKAHPRLLDTLLGVLDDGRLTSGQGDTSYFGQAVLIFTSNLGMYEEVGDNQGGLTRRPRFGYDTAFDLIERSVREAIRDEFVTGLGRPELLGRFGGAESIIVFDYLRDLASVSKKFVHNIAATCRRLHGIDLVVDDELIAAVVSATQARPDSLVLGGRGIRPELDRLLTNPLADYLFANPSAQGGLRASLADGQTRFTAFERPASTNHPQRGPLSPDPAG